MKRERRHAKGTLKQTLGTALAAGVVCALSGIHPAQAQQKMERLTVRTSWIADGYDEAYHLAKEKGWYAQAGLDVVIDDGTGSGVTVQMVGAGNYDIGITNQTVMALSREKGIVLKSVAGIIRRSDLGAIVPIGAGLKTPKDLEGKTCLFTPGSLEAPFLPAFFTLGKAQMDKVKMVAVDAAAKVNMYGAGQGDCMFTTAPPIMPHFKETRPSEVIWFSDLGLNVPSLGIVVREDTLNAKREAIRSFVQVTLQAWKYILVEGHVAEGAEAVIRERPQTKLSKELIMADLEAYRPFFYTDNTKDKPLGWQSEADWKSTLDAMVGLGLIKAGAKPSDYYTNEFIANP